MKSEVSGENEGRLAVEERKIENAGNVCRWFSEGLDLQKEDYCNWRGRAIEKLIILRLLGMHYPSFW